MCSACGNRQLVGSREVVGMGVEGVCFKEQVSEGRNRCG